MAKKKMLSVPYAQYSMEMRSGRIINFDEGFEELLHYTKEDVKGELNFKQIVPCVEYEEIVDELREVFITKRCACYQHGIIRKDGKKVQVVSFFTIQNTLLNGHRVLEVSMAEITKFIENGMSIDALDEECSTK